MQSKSVFFLILLTSLFVLPGRADSGLCNQDTCRSYEGLLKCRRAYAYDSWGSLFTDYPSCRTSFAYVCGQNVPRARGEPYAGCRHGGEALIACAAASRTEPDALLEKSQTCQKYYKRHARQMESLQRKHFSQGEGVHGGTDLLEETAPVLGEFGLAREIQQTARDDFEQLDMQSVDGPKMRKRVAPRRGATRSSHAMPPLAVPVYVQPQPLYMVPVGDDRRYSRPTRRRQGSSSKFQRTGHQTINAYSHLSASNPSPERLSHDAVSLLGNLFS